MTIEVIGPIDEVIACNCSICTMKGFIHWIVSADRLTATSSEEALSCYQFGTHQARHYFCKTCGISVYYIPRSHPDGYSVNLRCVEGVDLSRLEPRAFDGRDWERSRAALDRESPREALPLQRQRRGS